MNSATKVSEIFTAAGSAFIQLGDLTMQLQPNSDTNASGKWTDEEVDLLYGAILRFSDDLNKVSLSIKNRTVSQIRQALKQKAFEDAGIPAKKVPVQQVQHVIQTVQQLPNQTQQIHIVKQPTNQQNVAAVLQQQIIPIQQSHATATTTIASHQILQSTPKQIIIQQSPTLTTNPTLGNANSGLTVSTTPVTIQQSAPQIVHLQPQVLQQNHPQQQLIPPQTLTTTTTTMTVQQFQQLQQQKLLMQSSNAVNTATTTQPPSTTLSSNAPSIIENVVLQPAHIAQQQISQQQSLATTTIIPTTSLTSATATTTSSTIAPDVMMTLNRLNVQEHEVDVEELPADVVKLDFVSEEVAG